MSTINNTNFESCLFMKYLIEEGKFNPALFNGILELGQSAPDSLSQFLKEYRQYLLSKKVNYDELSKLGIDGANGYLTESGILVPKSFYNDSHFITNAPKVPYIRHGYSYPSIDKFDSIICKDISEDLPNVLYHNKDLFIGYCDNLDDELESKRSFYKSLYNKLTTIQNKDYQFVIDKDSKQNKEYCLIKSK